MTDRLIVTLLAICGIVSCVFYLTSYSNYLGLVFDDVDGISKLKFQVAEDAEECHLDPHLMQEISSYQPIVNEIIKTALNGSYKGRTWRTLARFVDKFGARIAGSKNLENAIDYMVEVLKRNQLENVHTEPVTVPHWTRGKEMVWMVSPRLQKLSMLGLGLSVGTPVEGITAKALVVRSFEELKQKASEAEGKIVVFNEPYVSYGETVRYRGYAAVEAAKVGAVAALIRSVAPFSIDSPHTGMMHYEEGVRKIPAAALSIEGAEMLDRLSREGEDVHIYLKMGAESLPPVTSRNTIAEITGSKHPEKVVVVSGHLDSWDVGQGAMDDGGGAFISWNALALIKMLELPRPKRTLRSILWTAEEEGLIGAQAYFNDHRNRSADFDLVMESDEGTFKPLGLTFTGSNQSACIVRQVLKLMSPLNATRLDVESGTGPDIGFFADVGVPAATLLNANQRYFWFHHSQGDQMAVQDPHHLDMCTALWAASSYVLADLSIDLPRN